MKIADVSIERSPERAGYVRLSARVIGKLPVSCWFDVPSELHEGISTSGNPWVVLMLPLALATGEDIELDQPVDPLLLEGLHGVIRVWLSWHKWLKPVKIHAPVGAAIKRGTRHGAFFSGGIDSFFTVLRRLGGPAAVGHIDDLITVSGFDLDVKATNEFETIRQTLAEGAARLGKRHVVIYTNLREANTPWRKDWGPLTHAAGLALIGLLLEGTFAEVAFGSTYPLHAVQRRGSHPMIDPLFSTTGIRIVHDGAPFTRVEKTKLVAAHQEALDMLRVCWFSGKAGNCSQCEKCTRTMITLDVLGHREGATTFDWEAYGPELVRGTYFGTLPGRTFYREILEIAEQSGRKEIVADLQAAYRRSLRWAPWLNLAEKLQNVPALWRIDRFLKRVAAVRG